MSHNDQNQPQVWNSAIAYDDDVSKDSAAGPYPIPPPPASITHKVPPSCTQTKLKGSGFWRGCCAGWCCYCCLDICF
ncbi:protein CYSTEINE-RICH TRANSMEMBRANE MODULE 9-like [Cicer arietinum]|uniref:protein CYSTEINE-RICH TRANSMEMBRANE MODULE 9-like n=1 Tax=Cicer arietinum TaxID=3827 RepID=UPI00032A5A30